MALICFLLAALMGFMFYLQWRVWTSEYRKTFMLGNAVMCAVCMATGVYCLVA